MVPLIVPLAPLAVVTLSLTDVLPLSAFGAVHVILPAWARAWSFMPFGAVMVTDTFWPLLSVTDLSTTLSPFGSAAPFLTLPIATGAVLTVSVRSFETTG